MRNTLKSLSIFMIVSTYFCSILFDININIITIIFTSLYIFIEGSTIIKYNSKIWLKNYILKFTIMLLFWNITYLVINNGIFINNSDLLDIIKNTILLKNIHFDLLESLLICYLFIPFINKKKLLIIIEIILLPSFILFKNSMILYIFIFIIGMLLNNIKYKKSNNTIVNVLNKYNISIYIFHKFIIDILIYSNIISINNIPDLIGSLVLTYIIGIIIGIYMNFLPFIRKLI